MSFGSARAVGPGPRPWHLAAFLRARDPGLLALKRSVRAALVMPCAFAIGTTASGDGQVALFAAFGSFALLLFVDLGGPRASRLRAYMVLLVVSVPLIILGTLCSQQIVLAVVAMAGVGFAVLFAGVLGPQAALSSTCLLLMFVLPVCVMAAPGESVARLAGLAIAAALAVPAVLLVWPRPWHDDRRAALAIAARRLAALAGAHAEGRRDPVAFAAATCACRELRGGFEATPYPPTGTGATEIALARMVSRTEWVGTLSVVAPAEAGAILGLPDARQLYGAVAAALRAIAVLVESSHGGGSPDHARAEALAAALRALQQDRESSARSMVDRIAAEAQAGGQGPHAHRISQALALIDPSFRARALSLATQMLGVLALEAHGIDPPVLSDTPGEPGAMTRRQTIRQRVSAHLTLRSVWLRNSLRGAAGLALAVAVAKITDVSHGFWVVLGTLSVLRSNALGTGATALRAVAGTVAGFIIGTAIMVGLGSSIVALWLMLPVAVLVAGIAPAVISFAAGQAGFTVTVVILFNILVPAGWLVGLVRVEDVALGCAISLVVGLLFWPRGATAAFGRALCEAYSASSDYLAAAVARLASPALAQDTRPSSDRASAAYRRMDDAYRQFLTERGAKVVSLRAATKLVTGAVRLRLAAHSLDTLPLRPLGRHSPRPAVATAAGELLTACRQARNWYLGFAAVLAGDRHQVPPADDDHGGLHRQLLDAFDSASTARDTAAVRLALRLLWAEEDLQDQYALQHELSHDAQAFAQQGRWRHLV
jgi:uncharacterized membrane protein YccC